MVGAFGLGNAFGAIAQGRLMDRLGQTRVLRTVAVAHLAACSSLVVAASSDAPDVVLLACAAVPRAQRVAMA